MDFHAAPDPVEAFVVGLRTTERLRGIPLRYGAPEATWQSSPNRVHMFLETAPLLPRAKGGQLDADLRCVARIWAASGGHAWQIARRLFWGWREWTNSDATAPQVEWVEIEGDTDEDTDKQGVAWSVRFILKSRPLDDVIDPSTGLVQTVSLVRV